ncbi:MAG: Si-specific NAD(P)(+) transhydrogenase [Terriglobales bacterium]
MPGEKYDLVVIGSGPAGQKGAICAAKLGKRVAIAQRGALVGGVCVHTGTIPSKSIREAVLYLTGFQQRTYYGQSYTLKERISPRDLAFRVDANIERETQVIRAQLRRNRVELFEGVAEFVDPYTVQVNGGGETKTLHTDFVLVACGTRPARNPEIPFDGKRILDTDQLLSLEEIPREAIVVGAGVVGVEYTSMLAALGVEVTLLDQRPDLLDFLDREIVSALSYHLRELGTIFRLGEKVTGVGIEAGRDRVYAKLESGKEVHGQVLIYAVGRQANGDLLNPGPAGLQPDDRGRLKVNEFFQTSVPHIYAAGDVIGFPALASTSMEQGRLSSCHMFGAPFSHSPELLPYGIYAIPEISMVGFTEEQLTREKRPYEIGVARYNELAKAQILGDEHGLLKLLFDPKSLKLLGVHIIGDRATELIHIGQAALAFGGTIEYFRDAVFNYPTLAEAYKVAAFDGLNRL